MAEYTVSSENMVKALRNLSDIPSAPGKANRPRHRPRAFRGHRSRNAVDDRH